MRAQIEKKLKDSAVKTFEETCFMYIMPELEDIQDKLPIEAVAEIKYRGNFTGKLLIEIRGGLLEAIAVNMLGHENPTLQQKQDALGEIANIICGNVIPALGSKGGEYKIESPCLIREDQIQKNLLGEPLAHTILNLNQGRADLKFFVNGYYPNKEKKVD